MGRMRGIAIILLGLALPTGEAAFAKKKAAPKKQITLHDKFMKLKRDYRQGDISKVKMWAELARVNEQGDRLSATDRVSLLQTQAIMLQEGDYPILAAIYSSQALKLTKQPLDQDLRPSWDILQKTSERRPIQNLIEIVADAVDLKGKDAPSFGSDWNYFAANAAAKKGSNEPAAKLYGRVAVDDRHFFPAKYQQAMIYVDTNKLKEAETSLKAIVYPQSQRVAPIDDEQRKALNDYALMALGRILYERGQFAAAARTYRLVDRDGKLFYDALFEQSWAFFMGGYPMHALGALHAVESPFYKETFNPEAPIVRALVHYWLCRYEDSRNAVADFMERYEPGVEGLAEFLERKRLDPETSYTLFENLLSGVTGESLGVPRGVLETASEKDNMMLVRDQYAAILEEKGRLENKGIYGKNSGTQKPMEYLERWEIALRKDIGKKFLAELQDLKREYDRLYAQAQFLYVELLMSEKDQILGKELHASSKITKVSKVAKVSGWGDKMVGWKDARNGEYWWDEVGYYITPVESQCLAAGKGSSKKDD